MRLEADKECLVCDYCGNIHYPAPNAEGIRVLDEPSKLACPICSIPLVHASHGRRTDSLLQPLPRYPHFLEVFMAVVQDLRSRRDTTGGSVHPINWKESGSQDQLPAVRPANGHPSIWWRRRYYYRRLRELCAHWLDDSELDRIVRAPDREYTPAARIV